MLQLPSAALKMDRTGVPEADQGGGKKQCSRDLFILNP